LGKAAATETQPQLLSSLSQSPPCLLAKTREPLPLFFQPSIGQTKRLSSSMAICLFSALFLFSSSIKGLRIKQHKPFIYVFLFQDWHCAWQQTSQPACLCRASFHGRLEHLQTTTYYRENEEIKREAEWQKSHLKKNQVSSGFSQVTRIMGQPTGSLGFYRIVAPAGFLINLDRSSPGSNIYGFY